MARATGVQITGSAVRVVDLDGSGKRYKVRGFGESSYAEPGEEGRDEALAKAVREAFKAAKASREHVVLGVPTRDCIIREITIPFTDPEQIKKVIKFEAEPHLHSCSIDQVVVCFHKVAESGNRSTILVVAARKEMIQRQLRALESYGVDPMSVDIDASGLFTLARMHPQLSEQKNYVVCEIGYTSTLITLVKNGDFRVCRSVRMGTDSILSRVSRDLDIDRSEARTRTQEILLQDVEIDEDLFVRRGDVEEIGSETSKSSGELERDIVRQRQVELVGRLHQEILRSINPAKLDEPLEGVYLTGPGSTLPRLKGELSELMAVPVKQLDVLDWFDHSFEAAESDVFNAVLPVSAGLALEFIGEAPLGMDFRQEEFVFAKRFDRLKVPLICLVLLITALNAFWYVLEYKEREKETYIVNSLGRKVDPIFAAVADPSKIDASLLDKYPNPYDAERLKRAYEGQSRFTNDGLERIRYMGNTILDLQDKLADTYGLNQKKATAERGRRPGSRGSGATKPYDDPSEYSSALQNTELVLEAIRKTGVRDVALNRLRATPTEVQFSLTIPNSAEIAGGERKTFLQILGMIEDNLKGLPPEMRYVNLEDRSPWKRDESYPYGEAVRYENLVANFEGERK